MLSQEKEGCGHATRRRSGMGSLLKEHRKGREEEPLTACKANTDLPTP